MVNLFYTVTVIANTVNRNRLLIQCNDLRQLLYQLSYSSKCKFNSIQVKFTFTLITQLIQKMPEVITLVEQIYDQNFSVLIFFFKNNVSIKKKC